MIGRSGLILTGLCLVAGVAACAEHPPFSLFTMTPDGGDLRRLVSVSDRTCGSPAYSPDGRFIAFDATPVGFDYQKSEIFVYSLTGNGDEEPRSLGYGNVPTWSPGGTQLAFMLNPATPDGDQSGIWVMDADGTGRERLCDGAFPRWSPRGDQIAYIGWPYGPNALMIHDLKTGASRSLEVASFVEVRSIGGWSPDGTRLVLMIKRDAGHELVTVDADGTRDSLRVLWRFSSRDEQPRARPCWSPDGETIVFCIRADDSPADDNLALLGNHLYAIDVDAPDQPRRLTDPQKSKTNLSPDWSSLTDRLVFPRVP